MHESTKRYDSKVFSGNIFIFHAFDIGEDINLEKVRHANAIPIKQQSRPKHFKNYHAPLAVELNISHPSSKTISSKIHNFGVISLAYQIPFHDTLEQLRKKINSIDAQYQEYSVSDANIIYKKIKHAIKQPRFFHLRTSYVVIQVDQASTNMNVVELKDRWGSVIASLLRFETESLSEYQKNEILDSAMGYYRGDLFIVDTEAAFVYDDDYQEPLDIFEFANIQQLELQYFDRVLDQQLNVVYQREARSVSIKSYLPFFGSLTHDRVNILNMLKVDISVIIERLESSIKVAGEAYLTELYSLLTDKLDLNRWKNAIENKLEIIKDINTLYQNKNDAIREDLLSTLIIVLIFIELVIGILSYLK